VEPLKSRKTNNSVVKSAIYFAFGTFMSRFAGLFREAALVAVFNTTISDAWQAAFRFPNLFRRIFGEGALSVCFIPVYVEFKEKGDERARAQLTAGILGLLLVILVPLSIVVISTMDWIIPVWIGGKGFSAVPGKIELTILLTKMMFPFLILVSLYAYLMALLNAHKKFMLTAFAPSLLNFSIIGSFAYAYVTSTVSVMVLGGAVLMGGVLQAALLLPVFYRLQIPYEWSLKNIWSKPVRKVLRTFLPSVLGLGIIQIMSFINTYFAATLEEGSMTYIALADRLLELPISLVGVSLGTAILPTLSELWSRNDREGFADETQKNMRALLFLCIPAAVGLYGTSRLLVSVLYERGRFDAYQVDIVSQIVQIYAITLVAAALTRVLSQVYYAQKNTTLPAVAAAAGLVLHLILAPQLMKVYGLNGLVLSTAIAAVTNCFCLLGVLALTQSLVIDTSLVWFLARCSLATLPMYLYGYWLSHGIVVTTFFEKLLLLVVAVGGSALLYFMVTYIFRVPECKTVAATLKRRSKKINKFKK
jgi:putative peptidoglycan lipid II flippase